MGKRVLSLRLSRARVRRRGSATCAPTWGTLRKTAAACSPVRGRIRRDVSSVAKWATMAVSAVWRRRRNPRHFKKNPPQYVWRTRSTSQERRGAPNRRRGFVGESPAENQGLPEVEGFVGERKARVLRDTGCNTVIVKRCLVSDKDLIGAKSPAHLLDRSVLMLPEASITVATPYFSGRLKAKCLENPI
ncbi:hypothetical protein HPB48_022215 [Haemaphysalis longicornis]|uniref:Uncharacterized protein n=1 Tax=Haemaphysalis longicornis TaxID=44386 RepID=A0A9J6FRQ0_HAELO|nr:hypothetical protein HPB48_022215 [Haemaphysalis longicornis]